MLKMYYHRSSLTEDMSRYVAGQRKRSGRIALLQLPANVGVELFIERPRLEPEVLAVLSKRLRLVPRAPVFAVVRVTCRFDVRSILICQRYCMAATGCISLHSIQL